MKGLGENLDEGRAEEVRVSLHSECFTRQRLREGRAAEKDR